MWAPSDVESDVSSSIQPGKYDIPLERTSRHFRCFCCCFVMCLCRFLQLQHFEKHAELSLRLYTGLETCAGFPEFVWLLNMGNTLKTYQDRDFLCTLL